MAGQLEECSDSKVMKIVMNGRIFKYHFEEVGSIYFLSPVSFLKAFA